MKLTDVARATLSELGNDYLNWLLRQESIPWSVNDAAYKAVSSIPLDRADYNDDVLHQCSIHILRQKHKFDTWLNGNDDIMAANCLLVLCRRLVLMLNRQIESQLQQFRVEGGFTEGLTAERLAHRTQQSINNDAPTCPICNKPMVKRVAKKGINSGKEFWSCSSYPDCNGTRNL